MKTIVYINEKKHSAWFSKSEANHQIEVLKNSGYKKVTFDFVDHNYENGHYFV